MMRAEIERMIPVYLAAMAWSQQPHGRDARETMTLANACHKSRLKP